MPDIDRERRRVARRAVERYGRTVQIWMLIEEAAELILAICRYRRGRGNGAELLDNIAEETADLKIVLEQVPIIYQVETKTRNWEEYKIERLERRIDGKEVEQ